MHGNANLNKIVVTLFRRTYVKVSTSINFIVLQNEVMES